MTTVLFRGSLPPLGGFDFCILHFDLGPTNERHSLGGGQWPSQDIDDIFSAPRTALTPPGHHRGKR
jgi:hypothetical protein